MSKTFKVVKEFEFPSSFGFSTSAGKTMVKGYCRGGKVMPAYAKGGHVESKEKAADLKQDKAMMAGMVHKHEAGMHPGKTPTKFAKGGGVPAYSKKPMVAPAKVGKVMGEFKHGDLKSSSGQKVANPKQAIAIALSEARRGKKG